MIFKITKDNITYQVNDLKMFNQQSGKFQKVFNSLEQTRMDACTFVNFDDAVVSLYDTGRVLVSINISQEDENETI